jgi:uncharacterized protein (DUF427 family)
MSLTASTGPLGPRPAGRLNIELDPPTGSVILWDPVPQRIRGLIGGEIVVDSEDAVLLHESGHLPVYYFPESDVRMHLLEPTSKTTHCPHKGDASYWSVRVGERVVENAAWSYLDPLEPVSFIAGWIAFYWDRVDEWFAEDEPLHGHARDPYHRIDVYPTSRHVRVLKDGEVLADSRDAKVLFETGLPPRYYLPVEDVRMELLEPSEKKTRCAYQGEATYWSAAGEKDVVWSYPNPDHDGEPIRGLLCFFQERLDLELDGVVGERPQTQWSPARKLHAVE